MVRKKKTEDGGHSSSNRMRGTPRDYVVSFGGDNENDNGTRRDQRQKEATTKITVWILLLVVAVVVEPTIPTTINSGCEANRTNN